MKVNIITIGDEILIGQIIDTNSAWMGQQLNLIGASINKIYSIGDDAQAIKTTLEQSSAEADVILITGGLGPTKDDITKKTIADYFGAGMVFHQPTYDRILKLFERWGRSTTEAHRLQCYMPDNAQILFNKMGTAPGMWFEEQGSVFVSMPGIPYEMKYLMEYEVIPKLKMVFPGQPIAHKTILTIGEGESRIAKRIEAFEESLPENIKIAYLPNLGKVRIRLTGKGDSQEAIEELINTKANDLKSLLPDLVYGEDQDTIEEVIGQLLTKNDLILGTAESCTGGHIAHRITTIPGSSNYFHGSIVAYANEVKIKQLGVKPATIAAHGAVSEATVKEMVLGALNQLEVDVAVAISGIAGPGGGTPEKPVGTVWIGVGNQSHTITQKLQIGKNRIQNIQYSSTQALNMVRKFILAQY